MPPATATSFTVSNESDFSQVLSFIDSGGANSHTNTAYTINILATGGTLDLTTDLNAINLASGSSLTINGNAETLDGGYQANVAGSGSSGLFVLAGTVTVNNLTIADSVARGGAGGNGLIGGGGGMGAGGGLFIGSGANVTLNGVYFSGDAAIGGAGGNGSTTGYGSTVGGGGGLGGAGGSGAIGLSPYGLPTTTNSSGGGGIGNTAVGGNALGRAGGAGIVPGAGGGGDSSSLPISTQHPGYAGGIDGGGGGGGFDSGGGGIYGNQQSNSNSDPGGGGFGGGGAGYNGIGVPAVLAAAVAPAVDTLAAQAGSAAAAAAVREITRAAWPDSVPVRAAVRRRVPRPVAAVAWVPAAPSSCNKADR